MRFTDSSVLHTTRSVLKFLDDNAASLGTVPTGPARKHLDALQASLEAAGRRQEERTAEVTVAAQRRGNARDLLFGDLLQPIVRIAQLHAHENVELKGIHMPRTNASDEALAAAANATATVVNQNLDVFVDGGLAPDVVSQLTTAASELTAAAADRKTAQANRRLATSSVRSNARAAVKRLQVINSLVRKHVKGNNDLRNGWASARRIPRKPVVTDIVTDPPSSPTQPSQPSQPSVPNPVA